MEYGTAIMAPRPPRETHRWPRPGPLTVPGGPEGAGGGRGRDGATERSGRCGNRVCTDI